MGPGVTWKDGGSWGDMERWWVLGRHGMMLVRGVTWKDN